LKPRLSSVGLPRLEKLKRWFVYAPSFPGLPTASSPGQHWRYAGFIKPATPLTRKPPSVLSPFAQLWCYLHWGDVISISSEGITPLSSLLRAHVPLPLGSLILQHLASFEESLQVVPSPCCPRELPDVISENLSLDAGSRTTAVPPSALTCFFPGVIGLPPAKMGSASRFDPRITTSRGPVFSRLQIFLNVPASKFAHPPDRPYRCAYCHRAAGAFTSGHIVLRYLRTHRIC
jgi:hypothetical protein